MGVGGEFAMIDRNGKEKAALTYELYICRALPLTLFMARKFSLRLGQMRLVRVDAQQRKDCACTYHTIRSGGTLHR